MARLKFEMWPYRNPDGQLNGYMSRFTDGKGRSTDSWWCSPPASIDHVGPEYLRQRHRHPNVANAKHDAFIKHRFRECVATAKGGWRMSKRQEVQQKLDDLIERKRELQAELYNIGEEEAALQDEWEKVMFDEEAAHE